MVLIRWATMNRAVPGLLISERAAQGHVGLVVEGGKAVVENIDIGMDSDGAGDGQPLLLAAGDVGAPLGDLGAIGIRLPGDEILRLGDPRRLHHILICHGVAAVFQIAFDRPRESMPFCGT